MYSAQSNPYQQYKQQSIMTMTQGEMLTQLYDGAIKQLSKGIQLIDAKEFMPANEALQKAQLIVNYLRQILDDQYKVSESLDALYEYFGHRIVQANIRKDTAPLHEIIAMLTELRDTFATADRANRTQF